MLAVKGWHTPYSNRTSWSIKIKTKQGTNVAQALQGQPKTHRQPADLRRPHQSLRFSGLRKVFYRSRISKGHVASRGDGTAAICKPYRCLMTGTNIDEDCCNEVKFVKPYMPANGN